MKITLKENKIKNDIEVLIEYPEMSETVGRIERAVKSVDNIVRCLDDDGNCLPRLWHKLFKAGVGLNVKKYCQNCKAKLQIEIKDGKIIIKKVLSDKT